MAEKQRRSNDHEVRRDADIRGVNKGARDESDESRKGRGYEPDSYHQGRKR